MDENKIHDLALLILGKMEHHTKNSHVVNVTKKILGDYHKIVAELKKPEQSENEHEDDGSISPAFFDEMNR